MLKPSTVSFQKKLQKAAWTNAQEHILQQLPGGGTYFLAVQFLDAVVVPGSGESRHRHRMSFLLCLDGACCFGTAATALCWCAGVHQPTSNKSCFRSVQAHTASSEFCFHLVLPIIQHYTSNSHNDVLRRHNYYGFCLPQAEHSILCSEILLCAVCHMQAGMLMHSFPRPLWKLDNWTSLAPGQSCSPDRFPPRGLSFNNFANMYGDSERVGCVVLASF